MTYPYGTVVEDNDGEMLMLTGVVSDDDLPEDRVMDAVVLRPMPRITSVRQVGDVGQFVPVAHINRPSLDGMRYKVVEPLDT